MISIFEAAHAILRLYSKQLHLFNTALAPPLALSTLNFILFLIVFNQPAVILDFLEPIPRPNIPIKYTPNKLPNFRRCLHRIFRPILHNLGMEPLGIRLLKGQMPVNHRKQRHAHTPHIHIHGLVPLAQQHLGKGIAWRPAAIWELWVWVVVFCAQAEVGDLYVQIGGQQDVLGFEVAVGHRAGLQVLDDHYQLPEDFGREQLLDSGLLQGGTFRTDGCSRRARPFRRTPWTGIYCWKSRLVSKRARCLGAAVISLCSTIWRPAELCRAGRVEKPWLRLAHRSEYAWLAEPHRRYPALSASLIQTSITYLERANPLHLSILSN